MRSEPLIPVRCPHCGARFDIDPQTETLANRAAPDEPPGPVAFRPTCPSCSRRVTVRPPAPTDDHPDPEATPRPTSR